MIGFLELFCNRTDSCIGGNFYGWTVSSAQFWSWNKSWLVFQPVGRNFHLMEISIHPMKIPSRGLEHQPWLVNFYAFSSCGSSTGPKNVTHHYIFDISGNRCKPWNSKHTYINIYIGHKVVDFSTKTTLLDHLGDLYVGGGDTAFFKKINISIEWIIRLFFEWINSLNEYFCSTVEWTNSLNEYFCRTIEWIIEWIKKVSYS